MSPEVVAQWWGIGITGAMALGALVVSVASVRYTKRAVAVRLAPAK